MLYQSLIIQPNAGLFQVRLLLQEFDADPLRLWINGKQDAATLFGFAQVSQVPLIPPSYGRTTLTIILFEANALLQSRPELIAARGE